MEISFTFLIVTLACLTFLIVTLACVCLSESHTFLIVTLVNTIETKPLHISLSNLQDMLTVMRGCTLLILEVRGQRSRSH